MGKMKKNITPVHTNPEFTLPAYMSHCPCPNCPGYKRIFHPYWRLNEHMKTDHGWPRKSIQGHLDRRKGGKMTRRPAGTGHSARKMKDDATSDVLNQMYNMAPASRQSSPASHVTSNAQNTSSSGQVQVDGQWDSDGSSLSPPRSSPQVSHHSDPSVAPSDDINDQAMIDVSVSPQPSTNHPMSQLPLSTDTTDSAVVELMGDFVHAMQFFGNATNSEDGTRAIKGFCDLLENGVVRVNTIMSATDAAKLEHHYARVSAYNDSRLPYKINSAAFKLPAQEIVERVQPVSSKPTFNAYAPPEYHHKSVQIAKTDSEATSRHQILQEHPKRTPPSARETPPGQKLTLKLNFSSASKQHD